MRAYIGDPCEIAIIRSLVITPQSWTVWLMYAGTGQVIASVTIDHEPTPDEAWALFEHVLDPA